MDDGQACCIAKNKFHQYCQCYGSISNCKTDCDEDSHCKGYAPITILILPRKCYIATTSNCSSNCELRAEGNVGDLVENETCGFNHGGCFIKQGK